MIKKICFVWFKFAIILAGCYLIGCSQVGVYEQTAERTPQQQQALYSQIANNFLKQAEQATTKGEVQNYKLKAAENFILAKDLSRAIEINKTIEITNQAQESYLCILKAQIALQQNQLATAEQELKQVWTPKQLPNTLQKKFYQTRAEANLRSGHNLEAAKDLLELEPYLKNQNTISRNSKQVWQILSQLTPQTLQELQQQNNDPNLQGWINFTHIMKQYDSDSAQMERALTLWQQTYPNHTASSILPAYAKNNAPSRNDTELNQPNNIALLLPLKGPYAASAAIIRDGFLAAHYEAKKNNDNRGEVKIYDTTTPAGIAGAYQNAIANNADFIVGPLVKSDVEALAKMTSHDIPILALNTTPKAKLDHNSNFFQFGLAPETDATEIADQIWRAGHKRVLVLVPAGPWGQRVADAFSARWGQHQGQIIAIEKLADKEDFSKRLRNILHVDQKEQKIKQLKDAGLNYSAEPHRRQDIDAIVLASNAIIARQIKPLLNFYYANNIPVYAHSAVYSGKVSAAQDQDLNGITFCDMPWVLDSSIPAKAIYKNIATLWPSKLLQSPRLFAFGIDAYQIANQAHRLKMLPDFGISGMTGVLTLDQNHTIQRKLMWAKFIGGAPSLLAK